MSHCTPTILQGSFEISMEILNTLAFKWSLVMGGGGGPLPNYLIWPTLFLLNVAETSLRQPCSDTFRLERRHVNDTQYTDELFRINHANMCVSLSVRGNYCLNGSHRT